MGKPKQREIIYQNGVPKIYLSGKKLKIASKKNNKSYKNRVPKKKCERKIELRVPKRRILWGEVRNWFKKEPGILKNANQRKELSDRIKTKLGSRNSHEYYF